VLPLLLTVTIFAEAPGKFDVSLLALTLLVRAFPRRESGTPLPSASSTPCRQSSQLPKQSNEQQGLGRRLQPRLNELPSLSVYRAHMLLMTALCILAVDFKVFPRALGKCETWGVSLVRSLTAFVKRFAKAVPIVDGYWRWIIRLLTRHCSRTPVVYKPFTYNCPFMAQTYACSTEESTCAYAGSG